MPKPNPLEQFFLERLDRFVSLEIEHKDDVTCVKLAKHAIMSTIVDLIQIEGPENAQLALRLAKARAQDKGDW